MKERRGTLGGFAKGRTWIGAEKVILAEREREGAIDLRNSLLQQRQQHAAVFLSLARSLAQVRATRARTCTLRNLRRERARQGLRTTDTINAQDHTLFARESC